MKYKTIKKTVAIFIFSILILASVFITLSDINKAKTTLFCLGLHKNNTSKFLKVEKVITSSHFNKCFNIKDLDTKYIQLIERYLNEDSSLIKSLKITDIYTSSADNWHVGCSIGSKGNKVFNKVEYILYADNALIICSSGGTIGISTMFAFFTIQDNHLALVGIINKSTYDLFDIALFLKFDGELIEWAAEGKDLQVLD